MDKKTMIALAENGPSIIDEKNRKYKNLCLYSELINGEWKFCCNNKIHDPIILKMICICDKHINLLKKKYGVDIKKEIIRKYDDFKKNNNCNLENLSNSPFIESIRKNLKINNPKLLSFDINPEKCWFKNINFLIGLPAYWFNKLIYFDSTLKASKKQGEYNGPDFIFQNVDNKKLIGFEIVSWNWNISDQFKNAEAASKYHEKLYNYQSLDEYINDMKQILMKKSDKANKYRKCDFLYLGIVVGNTIIDYHYYVIEYVLNKFIQEEQLNFNGVFIL